MTQDRSQREHAFSWAAATDSNTIDLRGGCFGSLLVPSGSPLIGNTIQFVAVGTNFAPTPLLSTPKTIVAGANPLTVDDIAEVGAVGSCLLRCSASVTATATLLWKS